MTVAGLILLAFAGTEGDAGVEWKPGRTLSFVEGAEETRPAYRELTFGIHVTFLGGDLDSANSTKWTDLWSTGYGFEAQYSHLFRVSSVVAVGPYAGFTIDVFGGDNETFAGAGTILDVDPLVMSRIVFGARVREAWGPFWMDQHIGIGPAFYATTTASDALGFDSVDIIDSSTALAFEIGLRFGVVVSRIVDLGLGLSYEFNGAPERGADVSPTAEFHGQSNFGLTFLINLNF